jgi:hypothetical protein
VEKPLNTYIIIIPILFLWFRNLLSGCRVHRGHWIAMLIDTADSYPISVFVEHAGRCYSHTRSIVFHKSQFRGKKGRCVFREASIQSLDCGTLEERARRITTPESLKGPGCKKGVCGSEEYVL